MGTGKLGGHGCEFLFFKIIYIFLKNINFQNFVLILQTSQDPSSPLVYTNSQLSQVHPVNVNARDGWDNDDWASLEEEVIYRNHQFSKTNIFLFFNKLLQCRMKKKI